MKRTLYAFLFLVVSFAHADWKPPSRPDAQQILNEAVSDAAAKRYDDALAKHVWFHQEALKHQPSLYGVRLSFALLYWTRLGAVYPPALEKLKSVRDEAAKDVREGTGTHGIFHDFVSINAALKEDGRTKDLFVWLHTNKPDFAKEVYALAQPSLIKAKQYELCGAYIDVDNQFQRMLDDYRLNKKLAKDRKFGKSVLEFGEKSFSNHASTLTALLVLNARKADAERIAAAAQKEWDDPQFKAELEKALRGDVPAPWP